GMEVNGAANPTMTVNSAVVVSDAELLVGKTAMGTLNVGGGSALASTSFIIGDQAGSTGAVTIDGASTIWNVGFFGNLEDVFVGKNGTGTLSITNGGAAVIAYNPLDIASQPG